jgi:DNA-directed RNA polymerase subunit K/omega
MNATDQKMEKNKPGKKVTINEVDIDSDVEDTKDDEDDGEEEATEDPDDPVENDSDFEDESDDDVDVNTNEDLHDSHYHRIIKIVPVASRVTSEVMTLFEYSDIIGIRTTQIENGAPVYTDVAGLISAKNMAIKELFDRKCPHIIKRRVGQFLEEQWSAREMAFPSDRHGEF